MTEGDDGADASRRIADLQREVAELRDALAQSEARFHTLTDSAPVGLYLNDVDGTATFINRKCAELVGVRAEDALSFDWIEYLHPDDRERVFTEWERAFTAGTEFRLEYRYIHADGSVVWTLGEIVPIRDEQGEVALFIGSLTDITAQKETEQEKERLQAQLTEAQRMESIGRLAGGVAHDFNNMLQVIQGYAALALDDAGATEPVRTSLVGIAEAADRSAEITQQLLAFARKQHVAPRVLDLALSVGDTLKLLQRLIPENIELIWEPPQDPMLIEFDDAQLHQIVVNLCINARDAIDDIGQVRLETDLVTLGAADCARRTDAEPGSYARLSVSDTGSGMDAAILQNIFEPFYSTKDVHEGTGLGLAIVYGVVRQQGGFIEVESEIGVGTTFRVHLPRYTGPVSEAQAASLETLPAGGGETILVVEDEAAILRIVDTMLADRGYRVLVANTQAEALAQVDAHGDEIRLLITDLVMPEVSGRVLAHRLRERLPALKCIYMSGYNDSIISPQGVVDDGARFLPKPFSIHSLLSTVREALSAD